jgi:hypothetical protein
LRHVNLASLLMAGAEAAVAALLPAVITGGPAAPAAVAAAAVVAVAAAALQQLRQADQRLRDQETVRGRDAVLATMDDILDRLDDTITQFNSFEVANAIAILQSKPGPDYIAAARELENQMGALLPSAWTYCCAEAGYEGQQRIEDTADSNAKLHEAITAFEAACKNPDAGSGISPAEIEVAAYALAGSVRKLRVLLVVSGVANPRRGTP